MNESVKKYGILFGKIIGGVIVLRVLLPVQITQTIGLIVFILMLDWLLEYFEKNTATKRALNKMVYIVLGIVIFLGLRMVIGYVFNMPLVTSYKALYGIGLLGMPAQAELPAAIVLELMFLIPGLGIMYAAIKGGKGTKTFLYFLSVAMFLVVLWQVKQPEHTKATKRNVQASISLSTTNQIMKAIDKEVSSKMVIYVALVDIDTDIKKGNKMVVIDSKSQVLGHEQVINVVPEKNGIFNGAARLVPWRKIVRWEKLGLKSGSQEATKTWKIVLEETYTGKGDTEIWIAEAVKDVKVGDKLIVEGRNFQVRVNGRFTKFLSRFEEVNDCTNCGRGQFFKAKALENETIKVTVKRLM